MQPGVVNNIVVVALTVGAVLVVTRQCRKPAWWPGRLFLGIMNARHSAVTKWGLGHVQIKPPFTILDVGCGGGKTVQTLAGMASDGKVFGIDYSTESVAAARRNNAQLIQYGRVDIRQASVSLLPFPDATFDVVTAVETHYFWPDLVADMREVLRLAAGLRNPETPRD